MMKTYLYGLATTLFLPGLLFAQPASTHTSSGKASQYPPEYADFYTGQAGTTGEGVNWIESIQVASPAYGADVSGDTQVHFTAPGMTKVTAFCWQQPTAEDSSPWGHDSTLASDITLDAQGNGSFVFPADKYPNGPVTIRIYGKGDANKQDLCELQLFNKGGVPWNQGIPKSDPAAAQGMKLAFSDDFNGPLSVSNNGAGATYESHKTGGGDFSGYPFSDADGPLNPFSIEGGFLRIRASKPDGTKGASGILSSAHEDGSGFYATTPCYFECRLTAQSAPGTWPAFWMLTHPDKSAPKNTPVDEYDVIEAYGGRGKGNPNFVNYASTTHFWNYPEKPQWLLDKGPDGKPATPSHCDVPMMSLGGKSSWSTTFHTYGIKITDTDTIYYLDDIEVLRHPTPDVSKTQPLFFMINYAIGGISGWHIDLKRYGNQSDMWVDYVRVYQGQK